MDIYYSSHFLRSLKKLTPSLKALVSEREEMFKKDPFDSRLETHKLTGELLGSWSFSITHRDRVLFKFIGKGLVRFDDVGDHDIYR